ncbi:hypothetical protein [Pontibacter akesuensis]|uniref:Uncharacterized protein n=1 Tax=Pontibacter akesuensis TaxID=388950 RepID=A0A1I7GGP1_9BACT|nr:hypothetical protein [Pontibacter akesuensis]GHA56924.1 hypothetical protein GCM10007389_05700 [Pontibacter akesuensis]SFU47662.1 hypothetical protein SAMN04487941_1000 [Pontibacter akesuensis]
MRFKDSYTLLKLKFLKQHIAAIKAEYIKHKHTNGFVLVNADNQFDLVEPPRFVQREFNKETFTAVNETLPAVDKVQDTDWFYYEVFWRHDWTTWRLKEIYEAPVQPS